MKTLSSYTLAIFGSVVLLSNVAFSSGGGASGQQEMQRAMDEGSHVSRPMGGGRGNFNRSEASSQSPRMGGSTLGSRPSSAGSQDSTGSSNADCAFLAEYQRNRVAERQHRQATADAERKKAAALSPTVQPPYGTHEYTRYGNGGGESR